MLPDCEEITICAIGDVAGKVPPKTDRPFETSNFYRTAATILYLRKASMALSSWPASW
jgi:hypothetical protein